MTQVPGTNAADLERYKAIIWEQEGKTFLLKCHHFWIILIKNMVGQIVDKSNVYLKSNPSEN